MSLEEKLRLNMRIYHAIQYEDQREVESLISDSKTDVNWRNDGSYFGESLLHQAAIYNKVTIVDLILQHGGDANLQDLVNRTPIFYCTSSQAIQLLLDNGAHLEHKDEKGWTPIHSATLYNRVDALSKLISHGAALNTQDNDGDTPLHGAARRNYKDMVDILLLHGSNLDTRNNAGNTALDVHVAKREKSYDCITLLEEAMTKPPENTKLEHLDEPVRLSTVLAATFTQPEFAPIEQEREDLKLKGILTKAFVQKLFDGKFKQHPFSVDDFFALLEYLLIGVKIDDSKLFIPCVLPLDDPNPADFPNKSDPILLTWDNKVLPQGFFPALIVQLLQRKIAPHFSHCAGEKQLRRAVCLDSQYGALRIVDQTLWFELYFAGKLQHSQIMLQAVEESSRALVGVLNIHGFGVLKRAFHCTGVCGSKDPVHPGLLLTDTNEGHCTKRALYRFALSSNRTCWINPTTDDSLILKKSPDCSDVFDLIKCHSAKWDEFARELKVPIDPRESLRHNISLEDEGRLERVVMNWIESQCSPVTWQNILDVLSSIPFKNTASKVKEFLKEQQVIDKYMSEPDYTPY